MNSDVTNDGTSSKLTCRVIGSNESMMRVDVTTDVTTDVIVVTSSSLTCTVRLIY